MKIYHIKVLKLCGQFAQLFEGKKDKEKIRGTNLGNWLVLKKWMKPDLFESTHTEDEIWLSRKMKPDEFEKLIR